METTCFSLPPPELSCLIGNLFTELEPPCGAGQLDQDGITLYGRTASGERGELHIFPEGRHGLALASEETAKDMDDGRGTYVVPACQQWIRLAGVWLAGQFPENISEKQF